METDPDGYACPIGAHIRRANPRDARLADPIESIISVNRHRIIRRGMPYGERLPEGVYEDDGVDRGLLFFLVNTDIARQFEFIQNAWLNDPKFNSLYNDRDPIVGSNKDPMRTDDPGPWNMTVQAQPVRRSLTDIPRFVWVKGGAYFFLPSISALSFLAGIKNPHHT
jgi:deferrochelatase/peroxidase EfeB